MKKSTKVPPNFCGNARQFSYLKHAVTQTVDGQHAFLLAGPDHVGKTTGLLQIVQGDSSSQLTDIISIAPLEGKQIISVDQVRELQTRISRRPVSGCFYIIIEDASTLTEESANALLKILEEPKTNSLFFLITSTLDAIPKTIISRCLLIRFLLVPTKEITEWLKQFDISPAMARTLAAAAFGRPGLAHKYLHDDESFERWQDLSKVLCQLMTTPIHQRLQSIEKLLPRQNSPFRVEEIIVQWLSICRDILLIQNSQKAKTFLSIEPTLLSVSTQISRKRMLLLMQRLIEALPLSRMPMQNRILLENCALTV